MPRWFPQVQVLARRRRSFIGFGRENVGRLGRSTGEGVAQLMIVHSGPPSLPKRSPARSLRPGCIAGAPLTVIWPARTSSFACPPVEARPAALIAWARVMYSPRRAMVPLLVDSIIDAFPSISGASPKRPPLPTVDTNPETHRHL